MGTRWIQKEAEALAEVKSRLKDQLASRPQYPDVIGDRRLIRFLRGKQCDVNETVKMFSAFLKWRDENNVDDIRNQILYGGLDTPLKFPNGQKIIELAPQIIISAQAKDYKGQPLVLEQYSFSPGDLLSRVTIKDYLLFLIYSLEYRALVMEQLSHERELEYLTAHPNPEDREEGYGVVLLNFCIRDLQGVGISHLTGKGKSVIEAAINIGLPNYPEYLGKCHMVNVPWVFTSMWFFIKGLLDDFILAKINLTGSKFMDTLLRDVPMESIPKALGGKFELYNESYAFDTSPDGPFYCASLLKPAPLTPTSSVASFKTPDVPHYPDDLLDSEIAEAMTSHRLAVHSEPAHSGDHGDHGNRPLSPARVRPTPVQPARPTQPAQNGTAQTVSPNGSSVAAATALSPSNNHTPSHVASNAHHRDHHHTEHQIEHHSHGSAHAPAHAPASHTVMGPVQSAPHVHSTPSSAPPSSSGTATAAGASAAGTRSASPLRTAMRVPSLSSILGRSQPHNEHTVSTPNMHLAAASAAPVDQSEKARLIGALRAQKLSITNPGAAPVCNAPMGAVRPHSASPRNSPTSSERVEVATKPLKTNSLDSVQNVSWIPCTGATTKEMTLADKVIYFAKLYPVDVVIAGIALVLFFMLDLRSTWKYVVLPVLLYFFVVHVL